MSDPFKTFVEQMARMTVPGDNNPAMIARFKAAQEAAQEAGEDVDVDSDTISRADDELLCGETLTFWSMIREARELLK